MMTHASLEDSNRYPFIRSAEVNLFNIEKPQPTLKHSRATMNVLDCQIRIRKHTKQILKGSPISIPNHMLF